MHNTMNIITALGAERYCLDFFGTHGVNHWKRVLDNATKIYIGSGEHFGENEQIAAALFAMLHDCERQDECQDEDHGHRAAYYFESIAYRFHNRLGEAMIDKIEHAIRWHNAGMVTEDFYTQAMWAADRLDLTRVGIDPSPSLLVLPAAIKLIKGSV